MCQAFSLAVYHLNLVIICHFIQLGSWKTERKITKVMSTRGRAVIWTRGVRFHRWGNEPVCVSNSLLLSLHHLPRPPQLVTLKVNAVLPFASKIPPPVVTLILRRFKPFQFTSHTHTRTKSLGTWHRMVFVLSPPMYRVKFPDSLFLALLSPFVLVSLTVLIKTLYSYWLEQVACKETIAKMSTETSLNEPQLGALFKATLLWQNTIGSQK